MAKKTNKDEKGGNDNRQMRLNLVELGKDEETPDIVVKAIDAKSQTLHIAEVDENGNFDIPREVLKKARQVTIGPNVDENETVEPENILRYRTSQFTDLIERGAINIAKPIWINWHFFIRCVTGKVRLCRRHPWWYYDLVKAVVKPTLNFKQVVKPTASSSIGLLQSIQLDRASKSLSELIYGPFRCYPICNGTVEVYRRTCCCRPWIIDDFRLPELIRDLEIIVRRIPEVPRITNLPDPPPEIERAFFKDGTLDEFAVNAPRDLAAIHTLEKTELAEYINARPYLICRGYSCGSPNRVATGNINPNGHFNICWFDFASTNRLFCHDEYAYIVKQKLNGITFTVYNGVAANQWYSQNDDVTLTSYSPFAFACRNNGEPGTGAFVFLDIIGNTKSYELITPNAAGWDRVAPPVYNSGLVFKPSNDDETLGRAEALGTERNSNWGGTLRLNYKFSEDMKSIGAVYYRIGIAKADNNGNPTGTPDYLSAGLAWDKTVVVGTDVAIQSEVLGPDPDGIQGGNANLYKIPYDADADWNAGQYHGYLNTTDSRWNDPTKRHLVTIEVFDSAGKRLRPLGTPATGLLGGELEKDFTFRRRYQDLGPTASVPYAALTHMFWWDNRSLVAKIEALNFEGHGNSNECQFLVGNESSTFGISYRAYHPNEMFQLYHRISWKRGLGTAGGNLPDLPVPYVPNPRNVNPAGNSPTNTFHQMLHEPPVNPDEHSLKKCAFAVTLSIEQKTFNGDSRFPGIMDIAAFALEIE